MDEEIYTIHKNETWELVERPAGKKVISVKWIYKIKTDECGQIQKLKARLVARGFTQTYGEDYGETFAPVSRHDTIRTLIAVAAQNKWKLHQMDVKSAFLNGEITGEVYVEQPPGFEVEGAGQMVYRLKKALYGLKQAPRAWYSKIDAYFMSQGCKRSDCDAAMYTLECEGEIMIISLYVDDLIITGSNEIMIMQFKERLKSTFEMTDLGKLKYFLGFEITYTKERVFLSQRKYAQQLLEKFGMQSCKSVATPLILQVKNQEEGKELTNPRLYRSMIGGLLYLAATRPDLAFAASYLSRSLSQPREENLQEAKRVLRYIQGTMDYGLNFHETSQVELVGFSDSDWAGCKEDMRSTTGMCFTMGSAMFTWQTQKQDTIAQSTAEAEYMALCSATNHAVWLKRLMGELKIDTCKSVPIYCDNTSAIAIGKNPVQHKRTKHIQIRYHVVREAEKEGVINLKYCCGDEQIADILTKPLATKRFEELRQKLGVIRNPNMYNRNNEDLTRVSAEEASLHRIERNHSSEVRGKHREIGTKPEKVMNSIETEKQMKTKKMREKENLHVSYADIVKRTPPMEHEIDRRNQGEMGNKTLASYL